MLVKELKNISDNNVRVILIDNSYIDLPANGKLNNINVLDLSGILKFIKVTYPSGTIGIE